MGCACGKSKDKKDETYGPAKKDKDKKDEKGKAGAKPGDKGKPPKPGEKPGKPGEKPKVPEKLKKDEKKDEKLKAKSSEPLLGAKPGIPGGPSDADILLEQSVYTKSGIKDGFVQTELTNPRAIHMCTCECVDDLEYRYDIESFGLLELCKARLELHPPKRGCTVMTINSDPPIAVAATAVLLLFAYYFPLPMALIYSVGMFGMFYAL